MDLNCVSSMNSDKAILQGRGLLLQMAKGVSPHKRNANDCQETITGKF